VFVFVEEVPLRIVSMALQHVEDVKAKQLIVYEPAILIAYHMLCPLVYVFHFTPYWIVNITDAAREEPWKGVNEHLFGRIKLALSQIHKQGNCEMGHENNGNTRRSKEVKRTCTHFIGFV
jgi:hypothetical protein